MQETLEKSQAAPAKRGPKPKAVVESKPVDKNSDLKDLVLSQQLIINKMRLRQDYMEASFKNLVGLMAPSLGGSFAKFKFDPPKVD